jgi:hypothetical protein
LAWWIDGLLDYWIFRLMELSPIQISGTPLIQQSNILKTHFLMAFIMAYYQILYWQDIPSQVKAWDDFDEIKIELAPRFIAQIDRAAQAQGLTGADDYLKQWRWSEMAEREGTPEAVAAAVKKELEAVA